MTEPFATMVQLLNRFAADGDDGISMPLPGFAVMRHREPGRVRQEVYMPVLCLVLQGAKQVAVGEEAHLVGAGQALLVSMEVPVTASMDASEAQPYLAVAVDLDVALLDEVARQGGEAEALPSGGAIALLDRPCDRLLDCLGRIVALSGRPQEAAVLLPGLRRELHYLLLLGPLGPALRGRARPDSHHRRIGRAVALLRSAFHEPLPVVTLAHAAGMSASAFHYHFKAVTHLSPRQYQKQLRLLEARRLMRMEGASARNAAFRVGYASPQQFTRDHARHFGVPPRRGLYVEPEHAVAAE
ncbi:AraC family transcriptional regulator [Sphingomonas sp. CROZ-RG-20F-R02-07]|uniref:AraC family transcriptional regulator n=1 Tax=Sphingomonas sp. CROZ-RG-20F-R02-07 TaxID=2914832 RepID=UPI001F59BF5B|nr:AraC family transcriptional regulator [Sphingomonas sp. CROZ-RG-20F-R02-07]